MLTGYSYSLSQEAFWSKKTQNLSRKSEAGPILVSKDRYINLFLTPSQAGLKRLPIGSLYEVDKSLEKQDYIH